MVSYASFRSPAAVSGGHAPVRRLPTTDQAPVGSMAGRGFCMAGRCWRPQTRAEPPPRLAFPARRFTWAEPVPDPRRRTRRRSREPWRSPETTCCRHSPSVTVDAAGTTLPGSGRLSQVVVDPNEPGDVLDPDRCQRSRALRADPASRPKARSCRCRRLGRVREPHLRARPRHARAEQGRTASRSPPPVARRGPAPLPTRGRARRACATSWRSPRARAASASPPPPATSPSRSRRRG